MRNAWIAILLGLCGTLAAQSAGRVIAATTLSLRGEPAQSGNWSALDYVNPAAPKGGSITFAALGTFDNFHRYALRGDSVEGTAYFYDSLMTASLDEVDVLYPLIAEKVEYAADYSWFIFYIDGRARNQNGAPITAEDAALSFALFFEKGVPQFRAAYKGVEVRALDARRVRYTLPPKTDNDGNTLRGADGRPLYDKDTMMSLAQLPVMVSSFWARHDFSEPLLIPPEGTGPYRVKDYKMGQSVTLERVKDYWAAELPVNKGRYNFDLIRYDYYRDANVAFEAFKAGEFDFRAEQSPKHWATGYNGTLFDTGEIVRVEIPNEVAQLARALVFNTQRPVFRDRKIRMALSYFFDFEWMNKQLFYSGYTRTRSYFQNTVYEARGLPGADEAAVLAPIRALIPPELWTEEYQPPRSDGSGYIREGARKALALFREAGWELEGGRLLNTRTGEQFRFELLMYNVDMERVALAFQRNLSRYGIDMRIRMVDTSQFVSRLRSHDFDLITNGYPKNQTPSSSLMIIWHSKHLDASWNTANVNDRAVDYLAEAIAAAQEDEEKLVALGRAFDRVLTWNCYTILQWHLPNYLIAYKRRFAMPPRHPRFGLDLDAWWVETPAP